MCHTGTENLQPNTIQNTENLQPNTIQNTENLQSNTVQNQILQISPNVSLDVSRQESFSDHQH